jgi:hypothetical protein
LSAWLRAFHARTYDSPPRPEGYPPTSSWNERQAPHEIALAEGPRDAIYRHRDWPNVVVRPAYRRDHREHTTVELIQRSLADIVTRLTS